MSPGTLKNRRFSRRSQFNLSKRDELPRCVQLLWAAAVCIRSWHEGRPVAHAPDISSCPSLGTGVADTRRRWQRPEGDSSKAAPTCCVRAAHECGRHLCVMLPPRHRVIEYVNDDNDGQDDTICELPYFYEGNVDDDSLCGYMITPRNIATTSLTATDGNGNSEHIGELYQYISMAGRWTASIRLYCPWMMVLDPGAGQYIDYSVTNSEFPGQTFRHRINQTDNGALYRTCSAWSFDMDTIDPCRPSTITLAVEFYVRSVQATDPNTCMVLDASYDGRQVIKTLLEVGWLDPMTDVEKVSNDIGRALSELAHNNCSQPVKVIETRLLFTTDNSTGDTLSCDDAQASALAIMTSNGLGVQPEFISCTVVEEPLPDYGEEAVYPSPEAASRAIKLPPAPPEDDGGDSGFPIWAIVLIVLLALLMCCCCWIFGIMCWRRRKKYETLLEEENILYEGDEKNEEMNTKENNPSSIGSGEGPSAAPAGAVPFTSIQLQKDKDKGLEVQTRVSKSLAWASMTMPIDKTDGETAERERNRDSNVAFSPPPIGIQRDTLWSGDDEQSEIVAAKSSSGSPGATLVSMISTRSLHSPNLSDEENDDSPSTQSSFSIEQRRMLYNPLVDLPTDSEDNDGPERSKSYAGSMTVAQFDSPRGSPILHKSFSQLRVSPVRTSLLNSRLNPGGPQQRGMYEPDHDKVNRPSYSQLSASTKKVSKPVDLSPYTRTLSKGRSLKGDKSLNPARSVISPYSRTVSLSMRSSPGRSSSSKDLKARARKSSEQLYTGLQNASNSQLPLKNGSRSSNIDSEEHGSAQVGPQRTTRMKPSVSSSNDSGNNMIQVAPGASAIAPVNASLKSINYDARPSTQPKSIIKKDHQSSQDRSSIRKTASRATIVEPPTSPTGNKERSSFMPDKGRSSAPQVDFGGTSENKLSSRHLRSIASAVHQQRVHISPDKEVKESKVRWEAPQEGGTRKAPSRSQSRKFIRPQNLAELEDPDEVETIVMESPSPVKRHG
eukprot:gene17409-23709_t